MADISRPPATDFETNDLPVVRLSSSEPTPLRLGEVRTALTPAERGEFDSMELKYLFPEGSPRLRAEIANRYSGVTADEVVVTTGAQEAIAVVVRALVERGGHLLVCEPWHQPFLAWGDVVDAEIDAVTVDDQTFVATANEIVRRVRPGSTVLINLPHNPTGAQPDVDVFAELVEGVERYGGRLVVDEVFRGAEVDTSLRLPSAVEVSDRAVVIGGLSKTFGAAGLRIGWIICKDEADRTRMRELREETTLSSSPVDELLAVGVLRNADDHLATVRARIERNISTWQTFTAEHADVVEGGTPRAGSVGFARFVDGTIAEDFAATLFREGRVTMIPGVRFGPYPHHFRVGFPRADFDEAVERLASFLDSRRANDASDATP